jgi:hypothetical protein
MTTNPTRERQLNRIRALLAKTTANGCTEAEAQSAAAAVDRLLAEYEIDLDEVTLREQAVTLVELKAFHHPVRFAAADIGKFCDCKMWSQRASNELCFLGLELDTEVAEYLVFLFMRAIDRESNEFVAFNPDYALGDRERQRVLVHSFHVGIATRLGERLAHMKSSRDFTQKATGFDLVVSKTAMVSEAFATLGIKLGRISYGASVKDTASFNAGRAAGDRVNINQGVGRNTRTNNSAIR